MTTFLDPTCVIDGIDPVTLLRRVTEQSLELVESAEGVLLGLSDGTTITYVCGAGYLSGWVGSQTLLDASIGGAAVLSDTVLRCDDTETDPRVDLAVCRRVGTRSTVVVPLSRGDHVFGVLSVGSTRPGAFTEGDVIELGAMAELISVAAGIAADLTRIAPLLDPGYLGEATHPAGSRRPFDAAGGFLTSVLNPVAARMAETRRRVQRVLEWPELLEMVFQPILDVATGEIAAVEALSRFHSDPVRPPDEWFCDAHRSGLGVDLEMLAVEKALVRLPLVGPGRLLTVNAGPETVLSGRFLDAALRTGTPDRVVLELTEHTPVDDYPSLAAAIDDLRRHGVRLAVDDTGAGFASLAHILRLAPDIIKLDRQLIAGIDVDPVRRALATSLVAFARDSGAAILAEGVETSGEMDAVRALGIPYAQGYFIGRPDRLQVLTAAAAA